MLIGDMAKKIGDALDDMPVEYVEYREEQGFEYVEPPAVPVKPKPVASVLFKYDGGEWLHMPEQIGIKNHPYEGHDHRGCRTFRASRGFTFILKYHLGNIPLTVGQRGRLVVTMLEDGTVYQGEARVSVHHGVNEFDEWRSTLINFEMEMDDPMKYTPDPLPDNFFEGDPCRCPDCDVTLEQRSMPDGIEEWCPLCNIKKKE